MKEHSASWFFSNMAFTLISSLQGTIILIVSWVLLLFFCFIISGAEVALFSLSYKDINVFKSKNRQPYKRIVDMLEYPKTLQTVLLLANAFVTVAIIVISNLLFDRILNTVVPIAGWLIVVIKIVAISFVLLLFGKIMPKVMATQNNIRFAKDFGIVVQFVYYIFSGFARGILRYAANIEHKLTSKKSTAYHMEELDHAIDISNNDTASVNEKNILKGIVKFSNITVKQIMRTRMDVSGIEINTDFKKLIERIQELNYSRLPVYREDLDEIVGIIHTKDLLPYLHQPDTYNWHLLIRPPLFVPEQKPIEDLLKEFQAKRIHFAIVVDEFGGTSGIVTLEDILEEVIGEIKDEFDDEETGYKKMDDYNYIFEGRVMINDVCKIMEIPADTFDKVKGESDSLAGLVLELAAVIPHEQQVVAHEDFEFTVLEVEKNRIQKIKISVKPQITPQS